MEKVKKKMPNRWIGHIKKPDRLCIDCGKRLIGIYGQRCVQCSGKQRSGENNNMWKGGITTEVEKLRKSNKYLDWRNSCFIRDCYTCQISQQKGGVLHVHHLCNFSDYPELRFDVDNGVTITKDLHILFHARYGMKNNTKEQFVEFASDVQQSDLL
jgi:hypothetical protein